MKYLILCIMFISSSCTKLGEYRIKIFSEVKEEVVNSFKPKVISLEGMEDFFLHKYNKKVSLKFKPSTRGPSGAFHSEKSLGTCTNTVEVY